MRIAVITRLLAFTSLRASTSRYLAERPSIVLVVAEKPVPATIKPEPTHALMPAYPALTRVCVHSMRNNAIYESEGMFETISRNSLSR